MPAEGVVAAARAAGRDDLKIATEDLGKTWPSYGEERRVRRPRCSGTVRPGRGRSQAGSRRDYRQEAPPYVAWRRFRSTHDNVLDAWKQVYHEDPPADLRLLRQ